MKLLSQKINIRTKHSKSDVIRIIENEMNYSFSLGEYKLLSGRFYRDIELEALINPPHIWTDPFRNRVVGTVKMIGDETIIQLKTKFGLVNILMSMLFYIPLIFALQIESNQDVITVLLLIGVCSTLNVIVIIFLLLKLRWDTNRLNKWLIENINDYA